MPRLIMARLTDPEYDDKGALTSSRRNPGSVIKTSCPG